MGVDRRLAKKLVKEEIVRVRSGRPPSRLREIDGSGASRSSEKTPPKATGDASV